MFTATTEIKMFVNGNETFSIINGPSTGQWWLTVDKMNRYDYNQGLLALADAANRLLIHKIEMDSKRVLENKNMLGKG